MDMEWSGQVKVWKLGKFMLAHFHGEGTIEAMKPKAITEACSKQVPMILRGGKSDTRDIRKTVLPSKQKTFSHFIL